MKRSEMQREITLFIQECMERDGFTVAETAKCLLDFIEGCGMMPPVNEQYYYCMCNDDRRIINAASPYFAWEAEDK